MSGQIQTATVVPDPVYYSTLAIPVTAISEHTQQLGALGIACLMLMADDRAYQRERFHHVQPLSIFLAEQVLGCSLSDVLIAFAALRGLGYADEDNALQEWSGEEILFQRSATRIDARRLGPVGLAVLAQMTNLDAYEKGGDLPISRDELSAAFKRLQELNYLTEYLNPVVDREAQP